MWSKRCLDVGSRGSVEGGEFSGWQVTFLSAMPSEGTLNLVGFATCFASVSFLHTTMCILVGLQIVQGAERFMALLAGVRSVLAVHGAHMGIEMSLLTEAAGTLSAGPISEALMGGGEMSLQSIFSIKSLAARCARIRCTGSGMLRRYVHVQGVRASVFFAAGGMRAGEFSTSGGAIRRRWGGGFLGVGEIQRGARSWNGGGGVQWRKDESVRLLRLHGGLFMGA